MPNDNARVFLDYTQAELDQAYDQLVWAPHRDAIQAEIRKDCEAVRQTMPPRTERYGKSEVQLLDIFAPKERHEGAGGRLPAWRRLAARLAARCRLSGAGGHRKGRGAGGA